MDILYTTPNGEYQIRKGKGFDEVPTYIVSRKVGDYYEIYRGEVTLKQCFDWLLGKKIISKDEYKFELDKYNNENQEIELNIRIKDDTVYPYERRLTWEQNKDVVGLLIDVRDAFTKKGKLPPPELVLHAINEAIKALTQG